MGRYDTVCEMKIAAIAIVVLAASGFAGAQESAKGTFQSQSITFDIGGAIAFNASPSRRAPTQISPLNGRTASVRQQTAPRR